MTARAKPTIDLLDEPGVPEVPAPERVSAPEGERPTPESELSPDQRRIRELEDRLAKAETRKFEAAVEVLDETEQAALGEPGNILIHVTRDGFTALDRVWYKGQEIEFKPGSLAYEQTKDRNGVTWLDFDDAEQMRRWGDVHFRRGPWTGNSWDDGVAAEAERRRARRAPVIR